jgi:8-oxo-dGTP diphosphatase
MKSVANHYISVDCVVFGFDGYELKVLLVDILKSYKGADYTGVKHELKLPGSLIQEKEDLSHAAQRTINEITGLNDIFPRQLYVFSDPNRISKSEDLNWIEKTYGVKAHRIVTFAYFALVKINKSVFQHTLGSIARWHGVQEIRHLAFDHKFMLLKALEVLRQQLLNEPIAFELLPKRFTIWQLQNLYKAVLGIEIDSRNFRRKVLNSPGIIPLKEKEKGVDHKPARLYKFDKRKYEKDIKAKMEYDLHFI